MAKAIKMLAVMSIDREYFNVNNGVKSFEDLCMQLAEILYNSTDLDLSLTCKKVTKWNCNLKKEEDAYEISSISNIEDDIKLWKEVVLELVNSLMCLMKQNGVKVEFQIIDIETLKSNY